MTSRGGWVRSIVLGVAVLAGASTVQEATAVGAPAADALGCAEQVFDPSGVTGEDLATAASITAETLGADLHVRVEGSLDGDIDGRERRLETECAGWLGVDGRRSDDLLVVMVSPTERQTSIYYGADFSSTLIAADPQIQEYVMNPRFKDGDYEAGLVDGLQAIVRAVRGGGVPEAADPVYGASDFTVATSRSSDSSSSGSDGVPSGGIIVLIVLVLIVIAISSYARSEGGWDSSGSSGSSRSSWSSSGSRSRSFSSSRRSSSGSSRRSSGSSRRSGGGGSSSKW